MTLEKDTADLVIRVLEDETECWSSSGKFFRAYRLDIYVTSLLFYAKVFFDSKRMSLGFFNSLRVLKALKARKTRERKKLQERALVAVCETILKRNKR